MNVTVSQANLYNINIGGVEYIGLQRADIYVAQGIQVYECPSTNLRIVLKEAPRKSLDDCLDSPYTVVVNELE